MPTYQTNYPPTYLHIYTHKINCLLTFLPTWPNIPPSI